MRAVLLVVAVAGCARSFAEPPPTPRMHALEGEVRGTPTSHAFAVPGEEMAFQVTLRGITVGHVVAAVGQPGEIDGQRAIIVRSRGASGGLVAMLSDLTWELKSVLSLDDGSGISEEETVDVGFAGRREHEHNERDLTTSSELNIHTAAAMLRAWRSQVGDTTSFDLRISDATIEVELKDAAHEYLASAKLPAVRYDGIALSKYALSIWISDDEARVPLRLDAASKWGEIQVELTSYDAPNR